MNVPGGGGLQRSATALHTSSSRSQLQHSPTNGHAGGISRSNTTMERRKERDHGRDGGSSRNDAPVKSSGGGGVYGEKSVLKEVSKAFPELEDGSFSPVEMALALLDTSSHGRSQNGFNQLAEKLESVVETIVGAHHRDLNANIDAYSATLEGIGAAQGKIREMKQQISDAKDMLRLKRADLVQTFVRVRQHQEILSMLDQIDEMRKIPEVVEKYKKKKAYPEAVTCLYKANKQMEDRQFADIGALMEMRRYLAMAYTTIHESIINDMQAHMYKSALATATNDDDDEDPSATTTSDMTFFRWQPDHASRHHDTDDPLDALDPESDSPGFIDLLLGSLSRLGKLEEALEVIQQRTPAELHRVVDRVFDISEKKNHEPVQFLRALSSRFTRVLEAYRLVYDKVAMVLELEEPAVARRIEELNTQMVREAWMSMQNEVKNVFYDYLTEDQRSPAAFSNPVASVSDVMKSSKKVRDRRKKLFKIAEPEFTKKGSTSGTNSKGKKKNEEDVNGSSVAADYASVMTRLERSVPSSVAKQVKEATMDPTSETATRIAMLTAGSDPYATTSMTSSGIGGPGIRFDGGTTRLLAKPGPITVAPLFRVTLEFISRARHISRVMESRDLIRFLEDYWQTFFITTCSATLAKEMGGVGGFRAMVVEVGVAEDEEEVLVGLGEVEDMEDDEDE